MQVQFKSTAEALGTGEYSGELLAIEQSDGQFGTQVKFTFALTAPEHNGRRLTAYARLSGSTQGKLAKWVQALLGRPIKEGETVDLFRLIGKPCVLVVVRASKPDGSSYNKIEDVLPAPPPDDLFEAS